MNEDTWTRAGEQNSATMRMNQLTYLLATAALTATIVFGASDDVQALLIVSAVGVALFGILTFDYAQQVFMNLVKSMPASVSDTPIGRLNASTPFAFTGQRMRCSVPLSRCSRSSPSSDVNFRKDRVTDELHNIFNCQSRTCV